LAALRLRGCKGPTGADTRTARLKTSDNAAAPGPQDWAAAAIQAPLLIGAPPAPPALFAPQMQVLTAMNGLPWWLFEGLGGRCESWSLDSAHPGGAARRVLPAEHVLGSVLHPCSAVPAPEGCAMVVEMGSSWADRWAAAMTR
jgi:2-dehydropantoate 2-reductase